MSGLSHCGRRYGHGRRGRISDLFEPAHHRCSTQSGSSYLEHSTARCWGVAPVIVWPSDAGWRRRRWKPGRAPTVFHRDRFIDRQSNRIAAVAIQRTEIDAETVTRSDKVGDFLPIRRHGRDRPSRQQKICRESLRHRIGDAMDPRLAVPQSQRSAMNSGVGIGFVMGRERSRQPFAIQTRGMTGRELAPVPPPA
jgi:hypothetical protein